MRHASIAPFVCTTQPSKVGDLLRSEQEGYVARRLARSPRISPLDQVYGETDVDETTVRGEVRVMQPLESHYELASCFHEVSCPHVTEHW